MDRDDALAAVLKALKKEQEWHNPLTNRHEGYATIRDELDGLWEAIRKTPHGKKQDKAVRAAAIETTARCLLFLIEVG